MDFQRAAIIIPVYKDWLEWWEEISLQRILKVFVNRKIFFICPENSEYYYIPQRNNIKKVYVPFMFMENIDGYNKMLLNADFYRAFIDYEYILICQLDVIVTSDILDKFCVLSYDYWGAPWPYLWGRKIINDEMVHLPVGNGGFSLRRVSSCIAVLESAKVELEKLKLNEDVFFSYYLKRYGYRIAPVSLARLFAGESQMHRIYRKNNGLLPFGMHAWHRFSGEFYKEILPRIGIEITEHSSDLQSLDMEGLKRDYETVLSLRLRRRVLLGEDLWEILPKCGRWCFYVVGENGLVYYKYLYSTLNISSNKMHYYNGIDKYTLDDLVKTMKLNEERGLLLMDGSDSNVRMFLQNYDLFEGINYVSLQQAYIRYLRRKMGFC